MTDIFIFDNEEISISIVEKTEKAAKAILAKYVKDPSLFKKEAKLDFEEEYIDHQEKFYEEY